MAEQKEVTVTNSLTGGQKGSKPAQLFDAPPEALLELAKVYGYGAEKYDHHNYRKGYNWSLSYNALLRHVLASINGEDFDPESGLPHMAHAAWHCLTLTQFLLDRKANRTPPELDDRYSAAPWWRTPVEELSGKFGVDYIQVCVDGNGKWDDELHEVLSDAHISHYHGGSTHGGLGDGDDATTIYGPNGHIKYDYPFETWRTS